MQDPEPLHPANAEELANIAQETGAEVLCGDLRYPSYSGGWQLGDLAHKTLDHAVLDAYGWPHDITDEQILERLLVLNLERAASEEGNE